MLDEPVDEKEVSAIIVIDYLQNERIHCAIFAIRSCDVRENIWMKIKCIGRDRCE